MKLYISALLGAFIASFGLADEPAASSSKVLPRPNPVRLRPQITIRKDTTYMTGPVGKDGYVDYVAAVNERLRQGATPENNAVVLLGQAISWQHEPPLPPEFFRLLGIRDTPPQKGTYVDSFRFVSLNSPDKAKEKAEEFYMQLAACTRAPWAAKDSPQVAAWLQANDKPLAMAVEASQRSQYYLPIVPTNPTGIDSALLEAPLPIVQEVREMAKALAARALLRAGQGDREKALEDLLAGHRLARLVGRGRTLLEPLVAAAMERDINAADAAYLESIKSNRAAIQQFVQLLRDLPAHAPFADKVGLTERCTYLDAMTRIAREGSRVLLRFAGSPQGDDPGFPVGLVDSFFEHADWSEAFRVFNQWCDRAVWILRDPDRTSRTQKWDQWTKQEIRALKDQNIGLVPGPAILLKGPKAWGKWIGEMVARFTLPAVMKMEDAVDNARQAQDLICLACELVLYRCDHGNYPNKLDDLVPKYMAQLPSDLFSGKPLIYRPSKEGFLLYSVGANCKDDGGRTREDEPHGDDVAVRLLHKN